MSIKSLESCNTSLKVNVGSLTKFSSASLYNATAGDVNISAQDLLSGWVTVFNGQPTGTARNVSLPTFAQLVAENPAFGVTGTYFECTFTFTEPNQPLQYWTTPATVPNSDVPTNANVWGIVSIVVQSNGDHYEAFNKSQMPFSGLNQTFPGVLETTFTPAPGPSVAIGGTGTRYSLGSVTYSNDFYAPDLVNNRVTIPPYCVTKINFQLNLVVTGASLLDCQIFINNAPYALYTSMSYTVVGGGSAFLSVCCLYNNNTSSPAILDFAVGPLGINSEYQAQLGRNVTLVLERVG